MARLLQGFSIAIVALTAILSAPSIASAQSQSVSVTDQRNTERTIRGITKTASLAELGLSRLSTNVESLLNKLQDNGADDTRLTDIGSFYERSASAARYRAEAKINRDASKQALKLRAKANSESLLADLEDARQSAIADITAAEAETIDSIEMSLEAVLTP